MTGCDSTLKCSNVPPPAAAWPADNTSRIAVGWAATMPCTRRKPSVAHTRKPSRRAIAQEYREVVESGQMHTGRLRRMLLVAGVCVTLAVVLPRPVPTAPLERRVAEHHGACY